MAATLVFSLSMLKSEKIHVRGAFILCETHTQMCVLVAMRTQTRSKPVLQLDFYASLKTLSR